MRIVKDGSAMTSKPCVFSERPDLGAAGVVALLTPAENPTAEPELSVLMPPDVNLLTQRMYSQNPQMEDRLCDYGRGLDHWMVPFGDSPLDAVGFACTGTSYLLPPEHRPPVSLMRGSQTCPLVAAAPALEAALRSLYAERITVLSPYPQGLTEAALAYWRARGFDVVHVQTTPAASQGHPIYSKNAAVLLTALRQAQAVQTDAIVALGTGAPSLPALAVATLETETPILSSNLCTAWGLVGAMKGVPGPIRDWLAPQAAWRHRLQSRFPTALERLGLAAAQA